MPRSAKARYEIRNASTWDELVSEFSTFHKYWLFRGQGNAKWELSTSIEREAPKDRRPSVAEGVYLREFKKRAKLYLRSEQIPENTGEWLALMQHYGAPTRLLDATVSPFVAAYFALEQPDRKAASVAIWAVHRNRCLEAAGRLYLAVEGRRPTHAELLAAAGDESRVSFLSGVISSKIEKDTWLKQNVSSVVPYEPHSLSDRLSIQQGAFLVPVNVDVSFMDNLAALGDLRGIVVKFVFPVKERPRALHQLRLMNITRASLFPGLDGFAQSFRQYLIEPQLALGLVNEGAQPRKRR